MQSKENFDIKNAIKNIESLKNDLIFEIEFIFNKIKLCEEKIKKINLDISYLESDCQFLSARDKKIASLQNEISQIICSIKELDLQKNYFKEEKNKIETWGRFFDEIRDNIGLERLHHQLIDIKMLFDPQAYCALSSLSKLYFLETLIIFNNKKSINNLIKFYYLLNRSSNKLSCNEADNILFHLLKLSFDGCIHPIVPLAFLNSKLNNIGKLQQYEIFNALIGDKSFRNFNEFISLAFAKISVYINKSIEENDQDLLLKIMQALDKVKTFTYYNDKLLFLLKNLDENLSQNIVEKCKNQCPKLNISSVKFRSINNSNNSQKKIVYFADQKTEKKFSFGVKSCKKSLSQDLTWKLITTKDYHPLKKDANFTSTLCFSNENEKLISNKKKLQEGKGKLREKKHKNKSFFGEKFLSVFKSNPVVEKELKLIKLNN